MPDQNIRRPKFRYQDIPDLAETFADSIGPWSFDGNTLRIEFTVSRLEEVESGDTPVGRRHPACRLVLTTQGANELLNLGRQLSAALEKAGAMRQAAEEKPPERSN